jgi:hypothetical protein
VWVEIGIWNSVWRQRKHSYKFLIKPLYVNNYKNGEVQIFVVKFEKHNLSNTGESDPRMMKMKMNMKLSTTMVTVCTVQIVVVWVETSCSFVDRYWTFIGIYCLQIQGWGVDGGSILLLKILTAYKIMGCQNPGINNLNSDLESPKSYTCNIFTITIINHFSLNWTFRTRYYLGSSPAQQATGQIFSCYLFINSYFLNMMLATHEM